MTSPAISAGDLNDTPESDPLSPLMSVGDLTDVLELQFGADTMSRWTYHFSGGFNQIDYLLVSKPLRQAFVSAGVERRGIAGLSRLTGGKEVQFDTVTSESNSASDHGAVWAEFNVY